MVEQTFSDFELIIINDGSTDKSEEVVKAIKDDRIKYIYQENQGAHNTINRGIRLAQGEYVSILNSDDVYYKNRFEEALKILESDSSVHAVFSHLEFIDEKGDFIRYYRGAEDFWKDRNPEIPYKETNDIVLDLLAGNFLITTSNLFCRRSVFEDVGYFENLKYTHDYDFFLRLCKNYKAVIIDTPLLKYRVHALNTLKKNGADKIIILHCISAYPTPVKEMNVATITDISKRFQVLCGLSDHSLGYTAALTAVEPEEFTLLVRKIREIELTKGKPTYASTNEENEQKKYRPSIFAVENIQKDELFSAQNIKTIRPGYGLPPKHIDRVIGKKAAQNIEKGTPINWKLIKK